jgi:hypothetical protein
MPLPTWPGEYYLGKTYTKDHDLLEMISEWEAWDTDGNHAKKTIKERRLVLLYSELDVRTS